MPANITPCESRIPPAQRAAIIDKAIELVSGLLRDDADEIFTLYARAAALTEVGKPCRQKVSLAITLEPEGSATAVGVVMRSGFAMKDRAEATIGATLDMFPAKGEGA